MRPHITLFVPCWRRYDLLLQTIRSAFDGEVVPSQLVVFDDGRRMPAHIREAIVQIGKRDRPGADIDAYVITPDERPDLPGGAGVSAVNWAIEKYGDLLYCNDDVIFLRDTVRRLLEAVPQNPRGLLYATAERGGDWAGLFYVKRELLQLVGKIDESFVGCGYFSDDDLRYRLILAGRPAVLVPGVRYGHITSATLKSKPAAEQKQHWQQFAELRNYYVRKWGGLPKSEAFVMPFGPAAA